MQKVIHVRSFLNLLSELSLVNQHLKLGKAELRRKVLSCRYKIFLIIHPQWKYYSKKLVGLEATFPQCTLPFRYRPISERQGLLGTRLALRRN